MAAGNLTSWHRRYIYNGTSGKDHVSSCPWGGRPFLHTSLSSTPAALAAQRHISLLGASLWVQRSLDESDGRQSYVSTKGLLLCVFVLLVWFVCFCFFV